MVKKKILIQILQKFVNHMTIPKITFIQIPDLHNQQLLSLRILEILMKEEIKILEIN
jgi:hypothetical protein